MQRDKQTLKEAEKLGWRFDKVTGGGHRKLRHTSGKIAFIPGSCGDRRGQMNCLKMLARLAREQSR